jgi:hypothetical protein
MSQGSLAVSKITRQSHKECFLQERERGFIDAADVAADLFGLGSFVLGRLVVLCGPDSTGDWDERFFEFARRD